MFCLKGYAQVIKFDWSLIVISVAGGTLQFHGILNIYTLKI